MDYVRVPSWSKFYSENSFTTLQGELDAIWAVLAEKANLYHSHSVTIPAGSDGGTFIVS
ncbi:hypothetical protein D3C81_2299840 [compost metagenome]